jgi:hypothetical protein
MNDEGLAICHLFADGVSEWAVTDKGSHGDWDDVQQAQAKEEFAIGLLHKISDPGSRTIIIHSMVKAWHAMATQITMGWSDEELNTVPTLWAAITAGERFLQE